MKKLLFVSLLCMWSAPSIAQECVILLHGMARTDQSMNKMQEALKESGYIVVNYDYPSTRYDINKIAKDYLPKAIAQCKSEMTINFVTHSLGGIVLRKYLSENKLVTGTCCNAWPAKSRK